MRFRDIEFRWSETNNKYELIQWYRCPLMKETGTYYDHKEYCCVVAFFDKGREGYDMRTVGDRFFEDKDAWVVGKYALEFLNAIFEIEKQEEEDT
jgi:hypothetical protein